MNTRQKNQEKTLRQSADFLRQAIDTIPGLVWSSLPDGHIDFLNQRWLDYTGLTLEEASGWGWQVAIHPGDLAGLVEYWKSVLASGKPGEIEARLRRFDGVHRWFLFRGVPLYDSAGKLVKWYGTNTDIEDLKLAEMQIRRNKAYLAEAQKLSRTGSFGWNVATGELVWSQETFCILGYTRESKPTLELVLKRVHPEDVARVQQTLNNAARDATNLDFEHRLLMPDGSVKYVHVLARAVKAEAGTLEFVGAVMEITERKNTEESLRRNETYLAEAQKLSKTGSFCLRSGGQEMICSEETVRIGGWPPGTKPTLEQAFERVHPEDRLRVQSALGKALQEGSYLEYEHRLLMPDGSVRHVHTVANSIRTASGQVEYVGAVMDITESEKAAEALDAAEHLARGQLDALVGSLTTLSQEPKPEKFLEHVLHLICKQLGAEGIGGWEMNSKIGYVDLAANYENGRLLLPTPEEIQVLPQEAIAPKHHPVWEEFFRSGTSCVYGELTTYPPFVQVASSPNGPWTDNLNGKVSNPMVPKICERLAVAGIVATICVPMIVGGKVIGLYSIRFKQKRVFRPEEIELTRSMVHLATLAIRLLRLSQQSKEAAVMAERNRLARDIHDTLAQGFTGIIMQLEAAKGAAASGNFAEAMKRIDRAGEVARSSLGEARRSVLALRPHSLREGSLCVALTDLLKRMSAGTGVRAEFQENGDVRSLLPEWEENILRITQESLNNTIKHAKARSFKATLNIAANETQLQLADDGQGFDLQAAHDGFGLIGMRERVAQFGGKFIIRSKPGEGTEILVILHNSKINDKENGYE